VIDAARRIVPDAQIHELKVSRWLYSPYH
jgi:hypothetical protein